MRLTGNGARNACSAPCGTHSSPRGLAVSEATLATRYDCPTPIEHGRKLSESGLPCPPEPWRRRACPPKPSGEKPPRIPFPPAPGRLGVGGPAPRSLGPARPPLRSLGVGGSPAL